MAAAGGGNFHLTASIDSIPTIFTQETVLATRSYIIEKQFVPALTAINPIMSGITSAPPLLGYVATSPKQTAQVILRTGDEYNDPILASWQYGLGRSVAFTSDATARWSSNWVGWDDFARFWNQAVRWTITEGTNNNIEAQIVMEGEQAKLVVDARASDGSFLNGLNLRTSLVYPDRTSETLALQQVAPGRYEAIFDPTSEGAYFLRIADENAALNEITGWVMSYSPEYRPQGESVLPTLAGLTGGKSLIDDPGAVFTHDLAAQASLTPITPLLLLIALLLLPFDVAVRRLLVTRSDLARVRAAIMRRSIAVTREPSERLSSLMGAKARARAQTTGGQQVSDQQHAAGTVATLRSRRDSTQPPQQPAASAVPSPATGDQPRYTPAAPEALAKTDEENIAGRLLQRRKEREP
jgi:hypothetical protein